MSQIAKLVIALALAVLGAGLNWAYLESHNTTTDYLAVSRDIPSGGTFPSKANGFPALPMPNKNAARLDRTLGKYDDVGTVFGARARREFKAGDPVFFSDIS